jgi:hypothetical protein
MMTRTRNLGRKLPPRPNWRSKVALKLIVAGLSIACFSAAHGQSAPFVAQLGADVIKGLQDSLARLKNEEKQQAATTKSVSNAATEKRAEELKDATETLQRTVSGEKPQEVHALQAYNETLAAVLRPVWAECGSKPWTDSNSKFESWQTYIGQVSSQLSKIASSVGMFVQYSASDNAWHKNGATGFVINDDLVVTNRHVAMLYATKSDDGKWNFTPNESLRIQFPYEYPLCVSRTKMREFTISKVEYVGEKAEDDYAILRLAHGADALPPGVPTADARGRLAGGINVAAIGYPGRPDYCNGQLSTSDHPCTYLKDPLIDDLFRTPDGAAPFPAERLSPGRIVYNPQADMISYFSYDSSTWGGSSGSPVVRLTDGAVIGLHFQGFPTTDDGAGYNNAILIGRVLDVIKTLQHQ